MRRLILLLIALGTLVDLRAEKPKFLYDVDFVTYFNNIEGQNAIEKDGTLFGMRLTPTIGVGYEDSIVGSHRLMAGVSYIQPFGSNWRQAKVMPTVYYQLGWKGLKANFGFVPYELLERPLPDFLMSDSMRFVDPNIRGALLQYKDHRGYIDVLVDWRGMMSDTVREAFRLVGVGRGYLMSEAGQRFYLGGAGQLNHLSHSEKVLGVCDDIMLNPYAGYSYESEEARYRDWGIRAEAGYLMSWQRDRRAELSTISHGFRAEVELRWWFVSVREQLYAGGNAMSLYPSYGRLLNQGDSKYQATVFSRTDIRLQLTRWRFVNLYAGWNIIYCKGGHVGNQQEVLARFNLGELTAYLQGRKSPSRL